MQRQHPWMLIWSLAIAALVFGAPSKALCADTTVGVDFNRDVRPILSDACYKCHGPDPATRHAKLRLDTREGVFGVGESGKPVLPRGKEPGELLARIKSHDADLRMPPADSGRELTAKQIATIEAWVRQGADWKGHWAYQPIARKSAPAVDSPFIGNDIDRFLLARMNDVGLKPSPQADRVTLLRRLSFDLTGLPPTTADVTAFLTDMSANAYEKQVDRLLASPHFGERMALHWLDLVRYADSIGYHSDNPMPVSPYRDYVIRSFNQNLPFDQFTREQLAGDLLPNGGLWQKVGSTYNRLLQTTEEGGSQPKEYEAKYAADRVRNVSSVWLGATVGCAQCHDHKYDPYTMSDFYQLAAYFADVQEAAVGKREPGMPVPTPADEAKIAKYDQDIAQARSALDREVQDVMATGGDRSKKLGILPRWKPFTNVKHRVEGESTLLPQPDGSLKVVGKVAARESYVLTLQSELAKLTGLRIEALADPDLPSRGPGSAPNGNFVLTEVKLTRESVGAKPSPVVFGQAVASHAQAGHAVPLAFDGKDDTGWAILPATGQSHEAVFQFQQPIEAKPGAESFTLRLEFKSIYPQHNIGRIRVSVTGDSNPAERWAPPSIINILASAPDKRTEAETSALASYLREQSPALAPKRVKLRELEQAKLTFVQGLPSSLITVAGAPRTVRILPRGNWLDETGPVVQPGVPTFLPKAKHAAGGRQSRLELANWLLDRDNPITARVFVNRLWKLFFGYGIARNLDDLGAQGEWPTHPDLLDYLAADFMDHGWDMKRSIRLLVMSNAYRQTSNETAEQREKDPFNRTYCRQSRWRLDAEMVRDNALAVSGLLVKTIGGPSVKPYQPPGYWAALNFPPREWQNDTGASLHRRGLYTHWQRSFLHPSLLAFDAPSREECTCERPKSNIPQQALALLNDTTFVEAAKMFAVRMIRESKTKEPTAQIAWAFREATSREPTDKELALLQTLFDRSRSSYSADPSSVSALLNVGASPTPKDVSAAELAAWIAVTRALLNLHETITRN